MTVSTKAGRQVATDVDSLEPAPPERAYCRLHRVALPNRYPVQPRPDLAFQRPAVVATRPGEELLCNSEHSGPHLWPDGDEAGEWGGTREPGVGADEPDIDDLTLD